MRRRWVGTLIAVVLAVGVITIKPNWSPICLTLDPWDPRWLWDHCWDPPPCDDCKYGS